MKVCFLIQSCNEERYLKEEEIIRNTWSKRLRKGCDLYFYRGDGDDVLDGDVLKLKCDDGLNGTFKKTLRALSVLKKEEKYDFIIRVNTSNWINVDLLLESLNTYDPNKRELIGCSVISNRGSVGIPFFRGNFLILNKQIIRDLFEGIKITFYEGVDDVCIALTLVNYYKTIGVDFLKILRTIPNKIYDESITYNDIKNNICIRCLEYIKDKQDSSVIERVDEIYKKRNIKETRKIKYIETILGELKI